jgi:transcriptional regulator GlxA family with amidase domain
VQLFQISQLQFISVSLQNLTKENMNNSRRNFFKLITAGAATIPFMGLLPSGVFAKEGTKLTKNNENKIDAHSHAADMEKYLKKGDEVIGMLMYPNFTALDLVGPQYFFSSLFGAKVHLIAKDISKPTATDTGVNIQPTTSFENCPEKLTILFVPGGSTGTLAAMQDPETLAFIKDKGQKADYVTSACTGSLLLGAAGLLNGYKATSHWVTLDSLKDFDAIPTNDRVVIDRNRITAAGVSAGLDLGLKITDMLRGKDYAEGVQLLAQYDPKPHLNSGSPETATPELKKMLSDMFAPFLEETKIISKNL